MKKKKVYKRALLAITNISYGELRPIVEQPRKSATGADLGWDVAGDTLNLAVEIAATALAKGEK